jgi:hypothetical protein
MEMQVDRDQGTLRDHFEAGAVAAKVAAIARNGLTNLLQSLKEQFLFLLAHATP